MAVESTAKLQPTPVASEPTFLNEPEDFSLVLGGPLFQLLRRCRLEGDAAELLYRRVVVAVLITWVPLLLAVISTSERAALAFFRDIEVHARFLVALPVLIVAEVVVHRRVTQVVRRFVEWHRLLKWRGRHRDATSRRCD